MTLIQMKTMIAWILFGISFAAGIRSIRKQSIEALPSNFTQITQAFSCGIFLGVGLLHMLGESSRNFYELAYRYPVAELIMGSVFLCFLWLEHIGKEIFHHNGRQGTHFVLLATGMLSMHSFLEGIALGMNTTFSLVITIFVAILAHKSLASFSLATQIQHSHLSRRMKLAYFIFFCLMTPLGIYCGHTAALSYEDLKLSLPILTAIAGGTFLYLGTLNGLDYAVMIKTCCQLRAFAFLVLGFILMAIVTIYT